MGLSHAGTTAAYLTIVSAFTTTAASEIGDRSFFTATILSLRYSKWIVFIATCTALCVQSLCAAAAGSLLQHIAALHNHTSWAVWLAALLFGFFAFQYGVEAYQCYGLAGAPFCEENQELDENRPSPNNQLGAPLLTTASSRRASWAEDLETHLPAENDDARELTEKPGPQAGRTVVFWRIFTLVYLAEIGDTSMFVTATLASGQSPVAVFIGANLANALVNGIGIWAGSATSRHLSAFVVNLTAACLFGLFSAASLREAATS